MKLSPTIQDQPTATLFPMRATQHQVARDIAGRRQGDPTVVAGSVRGPSAPDEAASAGGAWAFLLDVFRIYGEARAQRELERHRPSIAAYASAFRCIDATKATGEGTDKRVYPADEAKVTRTQSAPA